MAAVFRKSLGWVLASLVASCLVCFCSVVAPRRPGGELEDRRTSGEKDFDPLGFEDDSLIVTRGALSRQGLRDTGRWELESEGDTGLASGTPRTVYRVQIFMTKYPELASEKAREAEGLFSQTVYVDFEAPYYRVRLGDFDTLEAGQEFLLEVRKAAYRDAWLVKTTIEMEN